MRLTAADESAPAVTLRFGTDGVRGLVGADLTPELTLALGRAAARVLAGGGRGPFLVGRDTRRSGPLLQAALTAGLAAEGVDVVDLGVLPTPGVAALSATRGCPAAVISASHNPFPDNGIKLFTAEGRKLEATAEAAVEEELTRLAAGGREPTGAAGGPAPTGAALGTVVSDAGAGAEYVEGLLGALGGRRLSGMRVAIDCANGAAWAVAPEVFARAGADVVAALAVQPDGCNINAGAGSTQPDGLARAVVERGADVGLAFDGDADRLIAVDAAGDVVDGDRLLALFALDLRRRGLLFGDTVVVTVLTNLGFHRAMAAAGVAVHTTPVGDRHVAAALDAHGWSLGGEQSGHLIFRSLATTGDGILSGLLLLDLLARLGRPLGELAGAVMQRVPQVQRNVPVAGADRLEGAAQVWEEVAKAEAALGDRGRVLLRPSGTEPLVRVMVEADTEEDAAATAEHLVAVVQEHLGGGRPAPGEAADRRVGPEGPR